MVISPELSEKIAVLVETDEDLLALFSPFERSVIIALKKMAKEATGAASPAAKNNNDSYKPPS